MEFPKTDLLGKRIEGREPTNLQPHPTIQESEAYDIGMEKSHGDCQHRAPEKGFSPLVVPNLGLVRRIAMKFLKVLVVSPIGVVDHSV